MNPQRQQPQVVGFRRKVQATIFVMDVVHRDPKYDRIFRIHDVGVVLVPLEKVFGFVGVIDPHGVSTRCHDQISIDELLCQVDQPFVD